LFGLIKPVILDYLASKTICSNDLVVVSPDVGGVARARAFAKKLSDAPLAIVDKRRHGHNVAEVCTIPLLNESHLFYYYGNLAVLDVRIFA
jgi:phosphoribosylpyrophosphate synthetase